MERSNSVLVIIEGDDRVGKTSLIEEINSRYDYKYMTMDRGPISFLAYCDIYNRSDNRKELYKEMQHSLNLIKDKVVIIYLEADKEDLEERCKKTNHEILNFEERKKSFNKYYNMFSGSNIFKFNTSELSTTEILESLEKKQILYK